ncbi:MAG: NmrA/HSCARG family protein [Rhodothermales bacterium]
MSNKRFVLVTGATGQQGGAVAKALLAKGHRVRGITRNVSSEKAKALVEAGAEMVAGDFTHPESLVQAAKGVDSMYAMTTPFESGMEAETAQGLALIKTAKEAGVGHLVYSSVGDADEATGIPHFDSKYEVEKALAESGVPYSISAPVYFMDNLLAPWTLPGLKDGTLSAAMPGDRKLQQVSVANIGDFAVALFERRQQVFGQRFNIAGDELTHNELVAVLSEITGRQINYQGFTVEAMKAQNEDMGLMYEWFDKSGYSAKISALKKHFPEVGWQDFKTWASGLDWTSLLGS